MIKLLKSIIPKKIKEYLLDSRENLRRIFPEEYKGIKKYNLEPTQVYPIGKNFKKCIQDAALDSFSSLKICSNTTIASIGTCFAEEFATYIKNIGGNYIYKEDNIFNSSANWGRVYTIPNLFQIVRYSLTDEVPLYVEKSQKGYFDPLREYSVGYFDSYESALDSIKQHRNASKNVFLQSKVLVITLGQNEGWFDTKSDMVWGIIPPAEIREQYKDRFLAKEFSYSNNKNYLIETVNLIKKNNAEINIIFTVSPVASFATFVDKGIVSQSFSGKCILRAVVHEVQKNNSGIFYFPSFEMVLCDNPKSFNADNRHVKRGKVREIFNILEKSIL